MGWSIGVQKNELTMSEEVFEKLEVAAELEGHLIFNDGDDSAYKIGFDSDTMEHMDFIWQDWAQEALDDPSVNGDVVFHSTEGDDAGQIWGYRFREGKMTRLKAEVVLIEQPQGE